MKITKLGHCCLLVETQGKKILTDPGNYSTAQDSITGIDCVLISHEHTDHLHIESLKTVLKNNPNAKIITNSAVAQILEKDNIPCLIIGNGQSGAIDAVKIAGFGTKHAPIYKTVEDVENTGYFIDEKLFYPGDAFTHIEKHVDVLALPVTGPWMKLSDALDYAIAMKPRTCFPVHDGNLRKAGVSHRLPKVTLSQSGIDFVEMVEGDTREF